MNKLLNEFKHIMQKSIQCVNCLIFNTKGAFFKYKSLTLQP